MSDIINPPPGAGDPFVWFTDDDVEIVGDDICSKCRRTIPEDEVPLLLFRHWPGKTGKNSCDIARFHWTCAAELIEANILRLQPNK